VVAALRHPAQSFGLAGHGPMRSVVTDFALPAPTLTSRPSSYRSPVAGRSVPAQSARVIRTPLVAPLAWQAPAAHGSGFGVPSPHHMPTTTHTVVMSQLAEINECLTDRHRTQAIIAGDLGLGQVATTDTRAAERLPESAVLVKVCADGPPEYPYIHAHFAGPGFTEHPPLPIALHTDALRSLSRRLGLHHRWGL